MKRGKAKSIGKLTAARTVWMFNTNVQIKESKKVYKRNKLVNDEQNINIKNAN